MLLELQRHLVCGPVRSRRLVRSLGINVLPPGKKVCTFNCQYCQSGWTSADVMEAQMCTLDPASPSSLLVRASRAELEQTRARVLARGLRAEVF